MHRNRNPCNSSLMVKMARGMDHGRVGPMTTTTSDDDVAQHGGHPAYTKSCSLGLHYIILDFSIITQMIIESLALSLAENGVIFSYNHLRQGDYSERTNFENGRHALCRCV